MTTSTKLCHPDFYEAWDQHTAQYGSVRLSEKQFNLLWDSKNESMMVVVENYRVAFMTWRDMTVVLVKAARDSTLAQYM